MLQLLDCWRMFNAYHEPSTPSVEAAVLGNNMDWLRFHWEPRVPYPSPSGLDWCNLPTSRSSAAVAEVITCWEHQYQDYLRMIDTPLKLARVISNPRAAVPGNERGYGPRSASSSEYAAILLHDIGRSEEALVELETERRVREAAAHNDPKRQLALDVFLCMQERLTKWIKGEIMVPDVDG
jgi:hypothetical protein